MFRSVQPGTRFDLHLHTSSSDGRYSQEEVLERAAAGGLQVVALTDHDLVSTVNPGEHRFGDRRLLVIPGAELSGCHNDTEYHLCVYFPGVVPTGFRLFCSDLIAARVERYEAACLNLGLPGLPAPDREARSGVRALTRLHLAHALVDTGHAKNVRDAFHRFLGHGMGIVPQVQLPFVEAIHIARSFGGVTSWAHPPLDAARENLPTFVAAGLQGMELLRPRVSGRERRALRRLARAHGLFTTGGSDWHGWIDGPDLGLFSIHGRELRVFLDALEAAA